MTVSMSDANDLRTAVYCTPLAWPPAASLAALVVAGLPSTIRIFREFFMRAILARSANGALNANGTHSATERSFVIVTGGTEYSSTKDAGGHL